MIHAILETAQGHERQRDRSGESAYARHEPGPGRLGRLARNEDYPGWRRSSLYGVLADPARTEASVHSSNRTYGITRWPVWLMRAWPTAQSLYGPFGDFDDSDACQAQFRNAFLQGCVGT